jgi:glycosyltransferase involved in cell wall biosynthesis
MRIGVLANTIESTAALQSGGHVHFIEVARRLPDTDLVVFAPKIAERELRRLLPSATFVAMPSCDRWTSNRAAIFLFRSLAWPLRGRKLRSCDVLWATSHFLPDVAPAVLSGNGSVICIHHVIERGRSRAGNARTSLVPLVAERLSLWLARLGSRAVIAGSDFVGKQLRVLGFRQSMAVTTNGTDHLMKDYPTNAQRTLTALYLGRLHPTKGIDDLLLAWQIVAKSVPAARLVIAGRGEPQYDEYLRMRASRLGIAESVSFPGFVDDDLKESLLSSCRVFLFPSREEGWGIAIAEALRAGLPCITYDLPVYRGLFEDGRVGVPVGDVEALARGAVRILTSDEDFLELSRRASESGRRFTWDEAARIENQMFLRVAEARTR